MDITKNLTMKQMTELPEFAPMRYAFIGAAGDWLSQIEESCTLEGMTRKHPTWYYGDIMYGLKRLSDVAKQKKQYVFPIYTDEEIDRDQNLKNVTLVYHPADHAASEMQVLLLSGGAYGSVCTLVESMPVAAKLNEMGITAYSLNYRTASPDCFQDGLMPKPIQDVARAVQFIQEHFGTASENLMVDGFSAGGHLACLWGLHYAEYGCGKPPMLMLDYPLVSLENCAGPMQQYMGEGLLGKKNYPQDMFKMSVHRHLTDAFPKTYLIAAADDDTVPIQDSYDLESALKQHGIPHLIERPAHGGHGFGLGSVTDAAGWVERAISFFQEASK